MAEANFSGDEMAAELGTTRNTVYRMLHRLRYWYDVPAPALDRYRR